VLEQNQKPSVFGDLRAKKKTTAKRGEERQSLLRRREEHNTRRFGKVVLGKEKHVKSGATDREEPRLTKH